MKWLSNLVTHLKYTVSHLNPSIGLIQCIRTIQMWVDSYLLACKKWILNIRKLDLYYLMIFWSRQTLYWTSRTGKLMTITISTRHFSKLQMRIIWIQDITIVLMRGLKISSLQIVSQVFMFTSTVSLYSFSCNNTLFYSEEAIYFKYFILF
jgi:hypothetical protein